jgi:hypothetical protein
MQRYHSSEISSGVGDLFSRLIQPTADGWWDIALADYYGCQGEHRGPCPRDGERERSMIGRDGQVNTRLLKSLRDLGLSSDY